MGMTKVVLGILIFLAVLFFVTALLCIFWPEGVVNFKTYLKHYNKGHEERKDVRNFGMQLFAVLGIIFSFIYSTQNYQLAIRQFEIQNRPFLRTMPKEISANKYVDFKETPPGHSRIEVTIPISVKNEGRTPAHNTKFFFSIAIGKLSENLGVQEIKDRAFVLFPGEDITLKPIFEFKDLDLKTMTEIMSSLGLILELKIEYSGLTKATNQYFTVYKIQYIAEREPEVISIKTDA
jgi:hypothetical protein